MKKKRVFWKKKRLFEKYLKHACSVDCDSLLEKFFLTCRYFRNDEACIDSVSGCQSYGDLKLSVIAVASYLRKLPDKRIGIMLPASSAAVICYFATLLSGKLPVMVNWTLGLRELKFIKIDANFEKIITSRAFVLKVQEKGFLPSLPFEMICIEDVKSSFSLFEKLKFKFLDFLSFTTISKFFKVKINKEDFAVFLFTSGTEGKPKCVPLTHHNLLANQSASWSYLQLEDADDVFLSALPPFHALGFNITCLLPLLSGIRVVFEPNPLNGKTLARSIEDHGVSIICLTPTFLVYLLHGLRDSEQFRSVKLLILGGEAAVSWHYESVKAINSEIEIIQGYGVTECSPVITIVPRNSYLNGVGLPIQGLDLAIVDPVSFKRVLPGEQGLIIVKGTSLFSGYLLSDNSLDDGAFVDFEDGKWYKTGDLGYIDSSGSLVIKGRQKRFVKIGGEMVSIAAIEEILTDAFSNRFSDSEGPGLAVHGVEAPGEKTRLYLFVNFPVSFDEVNGALKNAETSNLIKISYIKQLEHIPLLGIGKVDYTHLSKIVESLDLV